MHNNYQSEEEIMKIAAILKESEADLHELAKQLNNLTNIHNEEVRKYYSTKRNTKELESVVKEGNSP